MSQPSSSVAPISLAHLLADIRAGLEDVGLHDYRVEIRLSKGGERALVAAAYAVEGATRVLSHALSHRSARERAEFQGTTLALRVLKEQIAEALRRMT